MAMIYRYEVELRLTNPNTRADRIVTRTEHAYGVMDAAVQAAMNQQAQPETGSSEIRLVRIGPPQAAILAASQELASEISDLIKRNANLAL